MDEVSKVNAELQAKLKMLEEQLSQKDNEIQTFIVQLKESRSASEISQVKELVDTNSQIYSKLVESQAEVAKLKLALEKLGKENEYLQ